MCPQILLLAEHKNFAGRLGPPGSASASTLVRATQNVRFNESVNMHSVYVENKQ